MRWLEQSFVLVHCLDIGSHKGCDWPKWADLIEAESGFSDDRVMENGRNGEHTICNQTVLRSQDPSGISWSFWSNSYYSSMNSTHSFFLPSLQFVPVGWRPLPVGFFLPSLQFLLHLPRPVLPSCPHRPSPPRSPPRRQPMQIGRGQASHHLRGEVAEAQRVSVVSVLRSQTIGSHGVQMVDFLTPQKMELRNHPTAQKPSTILLNSGFSSR